MKCDFVDTDQNIIDQVIEKCERSKVCSKLLEEGNDLTLEKAISLAHTLETVKVQKKDITTQGRTEQARETSENAMLVDSKEKWKQPKDKHRSHANRLYTKTMHSMWI